MKKKLLFYEKDEFYDYKELKLNQGVVIESVSKFIKNNDLIEDLDYDSVIIDISALSEFLSTQSLGEQILNLFSDEAIFIADKKNREALSYNLRFVFEDFEDVEKNTLNIEVKLNEEGYEDKVSLKRYKRITDLSDSSLETFFENFKNSLYGHSNFKNNFEEQIKIFRIFNKLGEHKILSFFLMGESGIGKTEVARIIFDSLGGKKRFAKVNLGNYSSEFSLSSLIGAARGYIGSDDGEIFMKVRETDVGVILIDEFEKSNPSIFNFFLDVLESGKITSSMGEEIDLNGFIIIFTSNIDKKDFSKIISPELQSRFDYKGNFSLLTNEDKEKYIEFRVTNLFKKVKLEYGIGYSETIKQYFKESISVADYKNMRDINNQIKKVFLKYLESNTESLI